MRKIISILLICFAAKVWGNKISDAYEALSIFDYFKAKQLFYKSLPKYPAQSAFGLATIYHRHDNPFSNTDSAAKYIAVCITQFKDTATYSIYHINKKTITQLSETISLQGFENYTNTNSVSDLTHFLTNYYFANEALLNMCYYKRDKLIFDRVSLSQSSDSVNLFMLNYPQSTLYSYAKKTFYDFQYQEKTPQKTEVQLKKFITQFKNNPNVNDAENLLFELTKQSHSSDSMYHFIKQYSSLLTKENAWKLLYSLSVKKYSKDELTNFLNKYPDYPYNEIVMKEISLSQNILLPLKNLNEKFGFVDTLGNWVISPQYDDANYFNEGFAAVCKNDSCFYIDKEGNKTSNYYFEEVENYKDGIAIVKKDNIYYLVNRSGQLISKGYQDISESSEKLFVCKLNNLYGAINAKGETVIPFTYNKLGNFKNKYAYYLSTNYGLVDVTNNALKAQWDWISDIDTNAIVIIKKNNKFGLMGLDEKIILATEYDYIALCENGIYLLVKNNLYGFYNLTERCYATTVEYDYNSSYNSNYYTNGKQFKLIKNDEVALVDANGRYSINYGTYTNLFFAKCDIIRVQKNNKYGFVDRRLKNITPTVFEKALDFENNLAIVSKESSTLLIDKTGKAIYNIQNGEITRTENNLLMVKKNELQGLINAEGKQILNIEYESINYIQHQLYACIKNNELYLFNLKTNTIKKL
jgi:hypothetical protein